MRITAKMFDELTTTELYEIFKARAAIFIMEQGINYQDMDDVDYESIHCFIKDGNRIIAYLRAFYKSHEPNVVKIGRVLTMEHGKGTGRILLTESLPVILERMPCEKIYIESQKYAIGFYEKFGFKRISDEFLEEGIIHVAMERDAVSF